MKPVSDATREEDQQIRKELEENVDPERLKGAIKWLLSIKPEQKRKISSAKK
jgi:hypothetical protein